MVQRGSGGRGILNQQQDALTETQVEFYLSTGAVSDY